MKILWVLLFLLLSCSHKKIEYFSKDALNKKKMYQSSSENAMIASQGNLSTKAGLEMFRQGGNVIDAFAAVSFAISVERPQSTGIGGGGFLLYYDPLLMDQPVSLDFRGAYLHA